MKSIFVNHDFKDDFIHKIVFAIFEMNVIKLSKSYVVINFDSYFLFHLVILLNATCSDLYFYNSEEQLVLEKIINTKVASIASGKKYYY